MTAIKYVCVLCFERSRRLKFEGLTSTSYKYVCLQSDKIALVRVLPFLTPALLCSTVDPIKASGYGDMRVQAAGDVTPPKMLHTQAEKNNSWQSHFCKELDFELSQLVMECVHALNSNFHAVVST